MFAQATLKLPSFRASSAGRVRIGLILTVLIFFSAVYLAFKFIPVWIAVADVRDAADQGAKMAPIKQDGEIRFELMQKIRENHLPVKEENVVIDRRSDSITIQFDIVQPIDLIGGYVYVYRSKIDIRRALY